jgi:ABC-2 type transport system permease protein
MVSYVPAVWVVSGFAVLAAGWAPRATLLAWLLVGFAFFVVYMGGLLGLPQWLIDVSPFSHVPPMPTADFDGMPLAWLTLVAAVLVGAGLYGFNRRDVEAT